MPVHAALSHVSYDDREAAAFSHFETPLSHSDQSREWITIGLVNNMPDAAFKTTERQFVSLLENASPGIHVRLHRYLFPEISRSELIACHTRHYASTDSLCNTALDGLIVTGREPMTLDLRDECYWPSFAKVLEWARDNTLSTVWSCLAAHAAILHMDGISRRKSDSKHFGIFDCVRVCDHSLTSDASLHFQIPHSRWNGVSEDELWSRGYTVLARAVDAGVDTFVKQENSLFVFFQGHPEYEPDTLMREYRRDV